MKEIYNKIKVKKDNQESKNDMNCQSILNEFFNKENENQEAKRQNRPNSRHISEMFITKDEDFNTAQILN